VGAGAAAPGGPAGAAGAAGEPHVGDGAPGGAAGDPQAGEVFPGFACEEAGWSQLGDEPGCTTTVGATAGLAAGGGAHVEATPALWPVGAAGRTGGADFFFLRRRRVIR